MFDEKYGSAMNAEGINTIPAMSHPLSIHWEQPDIKNVLTDDNFALMTEEDFNKLLEYSTSIPSGVYEGKMWKRGMLGGGWMLGWYGFEDADGKSVSTNFRELLIV